MSWEKVNRFDSSDKNVFKYVFNNKDAVAEAVLYRYQSFEERTVVCCSTMSGCHIGCRFCGTGEYFVRNLTAEEIVSQSEHLFKDMAIDTSKIKRFQIMFMSMGEPMLNWKELGKAIEILSEKYPNARLLISTSGPDVDYMSMTNLSVKIPAIGLQFSVHESTDEARNKLIPFKAKLTLQEIAYWGGVWGQETGRRPYFNYCVHPGNNSQEDVDRLVKLFDPKIWESTISVICERDESVAASHERQEELTKNFMEKMLKAGYSTRRFDPAGQDDIGGGCGQLWFVQDWMKENPEYAHKTVGYGKNLVHAPA